MSWHDIPSNNKDIYSLRLRGSTLLDHYIIFPFSLQDRLVQSTQVEEHVETEILAAVEQADVQSAPSEISTLDIQVSRI